MPYHILVVDDDREFREEIKEGLEDYDVIEAADAQSAFEVLKKPNEVDLIILDVKMPGMSGTDALIELKKIAPKTGIIISTGFSSESVAIAALKGHADEYIQKPVSLDRLIGIIERLLKDTGPDLAAADIKGKVEHVKQFARRNYHKRVGLQDAAKAVGLSPKYLSRIFRQETGKGFSDFKSEVKIEKAKEWLATTGYNVNQISEKLGYQNVESFIRSFKKFVGQTPSEYRKAAQKNGVQVPKTK